MDASPLLTATPFVGREAELAALRQSVDAACAGKGGVALLAGEPGIGKTRTAEELAATVRERGAQVFWGRCHEGDGAPAYWPWVQLIRAYIRERAPEEISSDMGAGAADIAEVAPELRERLPDVRPPPPIEPEAARFRLFDSVAAFLRNAGRRQPLVVVLDDLHSADLPSQLMLRFIARELSGAAVLVVGIYRDIDVDRHHPLAGTLAELARGELSRRIVLRGLGERDVARFIELAIGRRVPDAVVSVVYRETEGNPFFVTEVVRLMASEGGLDETGGEASWRLRVPPSVQEVIGLRLDRLSPACNRVLTLASFLGREFSVAALERAGELRGQRLLSLLGEAEAARVIGAVPGALGRFRFAHALIRETLYEQLTASLRVRLHRRIGDALEDLYGADIEANLAELAYHFGQAAPEGDAEKAIEYAVRAAKRASHQLAFEEAARHYELALAALDLTEREEARRCELLLALGEAQRSTGTVDRAKETLRRAADLAIQLDEPQWLARAALAYGGPRVTMGTVDSSLIGLLETSLSTLDETDSALRAQVLARLAMELYFTDARERRAALSSEAVAVARRAGEPAALGYVLGARHWTLWGPANLEERLTIADELVDLAQRLGDRELTMQAHDWRIADLIELGDIGGAAAAIEAHGRLAEELRQPQYLWQKALRRVLQALMEGDFGSGERLAREALAIGQRVDPATAAGYLGVQMFVVRREQGRLRELEADVRGFVERYPTVPAWRAVLALLETELGRPGRARREFERLAGDNFAALTHDYTWLGAMACLAEVCAALGDGARAHVLYEQLLPYAGRNAVLGRSAASLGAAAHYLALMAAAMGRISEARDHFEHALALNARMRAWPWVAHSQYAYAAMLLATGDGADRARAEELLCEALPAAQELGMTRLAKRAGALEVAPAPRDTAGLTARELEVVRLIAAGKSNREIAAELVISLNTVLRHVTHILAKTGAANRAEAASYAARRGLL